MSSQILQPIEQIPVTLQPGPVFQQQVVPVGYIAPKDSNNSNNNSALRDDIQSMPRQDNERTMSQQPGNLRQSGNMQSSQQGFQQGQGQSFQGDSMQQQTYARDGNNGQDFNNNMSNAQTYQQDSGHQMGQNNMQGNNAGFKATHYSKDVQRADGTVQHRETFDQRPLHNTGLGANSGYNNGNYGHHTNMVSPAGSGGCFGCCSSTAPQHSNMQPVPIGQGYQNQQYGGQQQYGNQQYDNQQFGNSQFANQQPMAQRY
jgi:hypothetical protein